MDLDGVVTDYISSFLDTLNGIKGTNYSYGDITTYNYEECLEGVTKEEVHEIFSQHGKDGTFLRLKLMPGALSGLNQLNQDGHSIIFLTFRNAKVVKSTHEYLRGLGIVYDELIFTTDKVKHGIEKNIELMIEDHLGVTVNFNEVGIRAIIVDHPWNREDHPQEIKRAYGWFGNGEGPGILELLRNGN